MESAFIERVIYLEFGAHDLFTLRVIWISDSPDTPSGFGNVTQYICNGLASKGFEVHIFGWQTLYHNIPWRNCTLHSGRYPDFGARVAYDYAQKVPTDCIITLGDAFWFESIHRVKLNEWFHRAGAKWVLYYPVDGETGAGMIPDRWVQIIRTADRKIVCSHYGQEVSKRSGLDVGFIPHGVDTDLFCPPDDKEEAKAKLNYDGFFVVLCDARNQKRKMLVALLEAFRRFADGKEDVLLHLHTDPDDPAAEEAGYDLRAIIRQLDLQKKVRFTNGFRYNRGLQLGELSAIYQSSDVHLLTSGGEGFGLPTLQAAATGVVPMATDYSANPELISGHGELIRVKSFQEDRFGIKRALIDLDDCADKLEKYYRSPTLTHETGKAAREFAFNYSWNKILSMWSDLLSGLLEDRK